jgi:hypothetical protein
MRKRTIRITKNYTTPSSRAFFDRFDSGKLPIYVCFFARST